MQSVGEIESLPRNWEYPVVDDLLCVRYKTSHAEISYVSTEQQEEDDFHLEEVRGSHSTKVLVMIVGIILFKSMGVIEQRYW